MKKPLWLFLHASPTKDKETTAKRSTRSNFREATEWAQHILLDPAKKAYYSKRAKALKLPNAYTAALTDYMRKPELKTQLGYDRTTVFAVSKKDFQLKKVALVIRKDQEEEVRTITANNGKWIFKLLKEEVTETSYVRVTDEAGREMRIMLPNGFSKAMIKIAKHILHEL